MDTKSDHAFAVRLYRQVAGQPGNLFISPASARVALAMAYGGARGETAAQMGAVLGFSSPERAHAEMSETLRAWNEPSRGEEEMKLRVVNRLWGDKSKTFLPEYLATLRDRYQAPLEKLDFQRAPDASRATINAWVDEKTEHKIQNLLQPGDINTLTRLVLTNAIYFKAAWVSPFPEGATKEEPFTTGSGKSVKAKLMHQREHLRYGELPGAKVLELPYKGDGASLVVVLPNDPKGLPVLEQALDAGALDRYWNALQPALVQVTFPRFTTTTRVSLAEALSAMAMPLAFDASRADFSGMDGTRDLSIGAVVQKAFVRVDEKGTEAAAATAVVMRTTSMGLPETPKTFRADHPFLFFLRDRAGRVLFFGRITDPTS